MTEADEKNTMILDAIVRRAIRSSDDDICELGHLFMSEVSRSLSVDDRYPLSDLSETLLLSLFNLSKTKDVPAFSVKVSAISPSSDKSRTMTVSAFRHHDGDGIMPQEVTLLADTTVGTIVSHPDPRWAGRFMARVIRTRDDIAYAIRAAFAMLMLSHGCNSRANRIEINGVETDDDRDYCLSGIICINSDDSAYGDASPAMRHRDSRTMKVPRTSVADVIESLTRKGYRVCRIVETGDWSTITIEPESM